MAKTFEKEMTIFEADTIASYYKKIRENQDTKNKFNVFSLATQWNLKKNIDALNNASYYKKIRENQDTKNKFNVFSLATQWNLKKNIDALNKVTASYNEFRTEKRQEINDRYFSDEMSIETTIKQTDENGEEKEVPGRQVKEEYMESFHKENEDLIAQLLQLSAEKVTVTMTPIDINKEIAQLEEKGDIADVDINMDDLDFLDFFTEK